MKGKKSSSKDSGSVLFEANDDESTSESESSKNKEVRESSSSSEVSMAKRSRQLSEEQRSKISRKSSVNMIKSSKVGDDDTLFVWNREPAKQESLSSTESDVMMGNIDEEERVSSNEFSSSKKKKESVPTLKITINDDHEDELSKEAVGNAASSSFTLSETHDIDLLKDRYTGNQNGSVEHAASSSFALSQTVDIDLLKDRYAGNQNGPVNLDRFDLSQKSMKMIRQATLSNDQLPEVRESSKEAVENAASSSSFSLSETVDINLLQLADRYTGNQNAASSSFSLSETVDIGFLDDRYTGNQNESVNLDRFDLSQKSLKMIRQATLSNERLSHVSEVQRKSDEEKKKADKYSMKDWKKMRSIKKNGYKFSENVKVCTHHNLVQSGIFLQDLKIDNCNFYKERRLWYSFAKATSDKVQVKICYGPCRYRQPDVISINTLSLAKLSKKLDENYNFPTMWEFRSTETLVTTVNLNSFVVFLKDF